MIKNNRDKIKRLNKYLATLKQRQASTIIPDRHKGQKAAYQDWLQREIDRAEKSIVVLGY